MSPFQNQPQSNQIYNDTVKIFQLYYLQNITNQVKKMSSRSRRNIDIQKQQAGGNVLSNRQSTQRLGETDLGKVGDILGSRKNSLQSHISVVTSSRNQPGGIVDPFKSARINGAPLEGSLSQNFSSIVSGGGSPSPNNQNDSRQLMFKNRDFKIDFVNNFQIRQRKNTFKEFIEDYKTRVFSLDIEMDQRQKLKEKEEAEDEMLRKKYNKLKKKQAEFMDVEKTNIEKVIGKNLRGRMVKFGGHKNVNNFLNALSKKQIQTVQYVSSSESEDNEDHNSYAHLSINERKKQLEQELYEVMQQMNKNQIKRETQAKRPTKIQMLKDDIDRVIYDNIQTLVDPNSNGAKVAQKMQDKEGALNEYVDAIFDGKSPSILNQQRGATTGSKTARLDREKLLPSINKNKNKQDVSFNGWESKRTFTQNKNRIAVNFRESFHEPLNEITINNKKRNVEFINFKKQHAVSTKQFDKEIKEVMDAANDMRKSFLKIKINESQEKVNKLARGFAVDEPVIPQQTSCVDGISSLGGMQTSAAGLPIFQNEQYIQDLQKLLSSKDLQECYDYSTKDQSYKKLQNCLKPIAKKEQQNNTSQVSILNLNRNSTLSMEGAPMPASNYQNLNNPKKLNQNSTIQSVNQSPRYQNSNEASIKQFQTMQHNVQHDEITKMSTDEQENIFMTQLQNLNDSSASRIMKSEETSAFLSVPKSIQEMKESQSRRREHTPIKVNKLLEEIIKQRNLNQRQNINLSISSDINEDFQLFDKSKLHSMAQRRSTYHQMNIKNPPSSVRGAKTNKMISRNLNNSIGDQTIFRSIGSSKEKSFVNQSMEPSFLKSVESKTQRSLGVHMKQSVKKKAPKKNYDRQSDLEITNSSVGARELTYDELNQKLMFPNNPAYFQLKKIETSDSKEAQLQKAKNDKQKNRTLLDYCREQNIAFTDTDKFMFNLKKCKDLHSILIQFLQNDAKVVDDDEVVDAELPGSPNVNSRKSLDPRSSNMSNKKASTRQLAKGGSSQDHNGEKSEYTISLINTGYGSMGATGGFGSPIHVQDQKKENKYKGANIAFDQRGKFNRYLNESEMLRYYTDVINGKIEPPKLNCESSIVQQSGQGELTKRVSTNISEFDRMDEVSLAKKPSLMSQSQATSSVKQRKYSIEKNQEMDEKFKAKMLNSLNNTNFQRKLKGKSLNQRTKSKFLGPKVRGGLPLKPTIDIVKTINTIKKQLESKTSTFSHVNSQQSSFDKDETDNMVTDNSNMGDHAQIQNSIKSGEYVEIMQKKLLQRVKSKEMNSRKTDNRTQNNSPHVKFHTIGSQYNSLNKFRSPQSIQSKAAAQVKKIQSSGDKEIIVHRYRTIGRHGRDMLEDLGKQIIQTDIRRMYERRNNNFKDSLQKLENSINNPSFRNEYLKQKVQNRQVNGAKLQESQEGSIETNSENSDDSQVSQTDSEQNRVQQAKIRKADPAYGMLDACKKRIQVKHKIKCNTNKLMERVDLDRPILQREKFELIFLEKLEEDTTEQQHYANMYDSQTSQLFQGGFDSKSSDLYNHMTRNLQLKPDTVSRQGASSQAGNHVNPSQIDGDVHSKSPDQKEVRKTDIKVSEIRKAMKDRMKRRKHDNRMQLQAYKTMCVFLKNRFYEEKEMPLQLEIKILEVLKKIVESGWIVTRPEICQIMRFLGIERQQTIGKQNYHFKKFIEMILHEFNIDCPVKAVFM